MLEDMVVVDHFSKYVVFIPVLTKFITEDAALLFSKHVIKC